MIERIKTRRFIFEIKPGEQSQCIKIGAGVNKPERIVPPAGEDFAFDVDHWTREVEVYVSPTGRSVRVWVDGVEIKRD